MRLFRFDSGTTAMTQKLKHLDFIQAIINRMAHNSFMLKGWSVILVSALFALTAAKDAKLIFVAFAYFPVIMFWILDGYFLWQERLFRKLYDHVRIMDESNIDFSMNTSDFVGGKNRWHRSMFSITLNIFYGTILFVMICVTIGLYFTNTKG